MLWEARGTGNLLSNVENRLKYLAEKQLNFLRSDKLQIQNLVQIAIGNKRKSKREGKEREEKGLKAAAAVAKLS